MFRLIYLFAFFTVVCFLSCEKKTATPATNHTNPNNTDTNSGKIFTIAGDGYQVTMGGGYTGDGGPATAAELDGPYAVAVDVSGNIYITDAGNCIIRKVSTQGIISDFAGVEHVGYSGDGGPATAAELANPNGLAIDGLGNLYISDNANNCIRKVNVTGIISTFAGNGTQGFSGDGGPATAAELSLPFGLAVDGLGNLYIADFSNCRIRRVNTNGVISTITGNGYQKYSGDGGPATAAEINIPQGVGVDGTGNVFIADAGNDRIRKINTSGIISTIAGNGYGASVIGGGSYSGDGGPATAAELYNPTDVKVDGVGNVYIDDADNERIRMVTPDGTISTIAGDGYFGSYGYSGDGGPALAAETGYAPGIALDGSANIYLADSYVNRIRIVYK